jgi:AraC family transcriptional activator of tynA and feaB
VSRVERGLSRRHARFTDARPWLQRRPLQTIRLALQDCCPVESIVHPNDDFLSAPELDYDGFRAALREDWGWFSPALESNIFAGKVRTRRVFGFVATDLTCNATRVERTGKDIRRDDREYYYAVVQLTGGSTIIHDDRVVNVAAGDVVLLDSRRPVTFVPKAEHRNAQWLSLQLPRQNLVSHLGFEPRGGACGCGRAQASRLLCQLALDPVSDAEPASASADQFMPLVVYDLLGALFAPHRPPRLAQATTISCSCASAAS